MTLLNTVNCSSLGQIIDIYDITVKEEKVETSCKILKIKPTVGFNIMLSQTAPSLKPTDLLFKSKTVRVVRILESWRKTLNT